MAKKNFAIQISDFSGGLNTRDSAFETATNQAKILTNFDIVGQGSIQKRYGFDVVSSGGASDEGVRGLTRYKQADGDKFLAIYNNAKLYTITPSSSTWTDQGSYGTDAGERVNGTVFNDLLIFGNGNTANVVKKFDGSTLANLGGTPPKASIFEAHPVVLFVSGIAGASDSVIQWCDIDDPENWSTGIASFLNIAKNNGEAITGVKVHNDQILVLKEQSKYAITPFFDSNDLTAGFKPTELYDKSDGALSSNSIVDVWDGVYFFGRQGFQKYGIQENFPDRRIPSSLSFLIDPTVKNINRANSNKVTSIFWNDKIYNAVPIGTSSTNNGILVMDKRFANNPWTLYTGMNVSDFEIFEDSDGNETIYFGSEHEGTVYKFNERFSDAFDGEDGFAIESTYRSKTFVQSFKNKFNRVLIRGAMTDPCTYRVILNVDGVSESFDVTEGDIQFQSQVSGVVGYDVVGHTKLLGTSLEDELKSFLTEIHFPDTINYGREVYIEVQSNNENEGIRLDFITIEGEMEDQKVIK